MAAAQTKGHDEDKHTGMQEKIRKKRKRKVESQAQEQASKNVLAMIPVSSRRTCWCTKHNETTYTCCSSTGGLC